jgi:hypothetical protein
MPRPLLHKTDSIRDRSLTEACLQRRFQGVSITTGQSGGVSKREKRKPERNATESENKRMKQTPMAMSEQPEVVVPQATTSHVHSVVQPPSVVSTEEEAEEFVRKIVWMKTRKTSRMS